MNTSNGSQGGVVPVAPHHPGACPCHTAVLTLIHLLTKKRGGYHGNAAKVAAGVRTGQGEGVPWETPCCPCAHSSFVGVSSVAIAPASFPRSQETWLLRRCHGRCHRHRGPHRSQRRHPVEMSRCLAPYSGTHYSICAKSRLI